MTRRALLFVACIAFSACGELLDPAAAVVNEQKILVEEVRDAVADFRASPEFERLANQGDADAITREFEQSFLSQLIRRAVLAPKADELGISVTDAEVDEELQRIEDEFPSESAFLEALKEQGLTLTQLEQLVRDRALEEKIRAEILEREGPDETELRAYYDDNADDFVETEAQHILVRERALAEDLAARLQAAPRGEVDELFPRLAERHSRDRSSRDLGGELGFNPPGTFVPPFEAAVDALDIGEISDPVQTRFGWHVIRVTDRRPQPFEQVREQIQAELGLPSDDEIWNEWVKQAYIDADVRVNPRYGEFNIETQQVESASARTVPGAEEPEANPSVTPSP
ncbi:MAG: peptidyl-prolyl cis-trans isomerase [Actinomycetota bacterium]|nr:peptidyl-prolyl cis-trans isomerase [Actinomycetota bacterium]